METREKLLEIMGRYTVESTVIPAGNFRKELEEYLDLDDWEMEEYDEIEKDIQREYSIKFHWGHNHDFGTFKLDGVLGNRHIDLLESFIDDFGLPMDLSRTRVLDVGAWCGGTTLLLAGMGAQVLAIEEVIKYRDCLRYLAKSFDLDENDLFQMIFGDAAISVSNKSLYDLEIDAHFDYIIFPGVLYHLSDPLVALRILFNALKDGGELYLETAITPNLCRDCNERPMLEFWNGEGNNWFLPNFWAIRQMLYQVGFEHVSTIIEKRERAFCKATRKEWKPMLKAGLSRSVR